MVTAASRLSDIGTCVLLVLAQRKARRRALTLLADVTDGSEPGTPCAACAISSAMSRVSIDDGAASRLDIRC
jgi:hypothetical protein